MRYWQQGWDAIGLTRYGKPTLFEAINRQLDFIYAIISSSYAVGLASQTKAARWNAMAVLVGPLRIALVIDFHAIFFYELNHAMQHMSSWEYSAPAFAAWILFGDGFGKAIPPDLLGQSSKQRKVRLPTFFFFNFLFYTALCLFGVALSYLILVVADGFVNTRQYLGPGISIDVPFFFVVLGVSYFFGFGVGALVKKLSLYVPLMGLVFYFGAPFLFLLSGVYNSYVYMPSVVQNVMVWSPMLPVIEYSRFALDPGYFASESSLWYPFCLSFVFLFVFMVMDHSKSEPKEKD